VTGESWGSGNMDFATLKYDASGNEVWVVRYSGPGNGHDEYPHLALDDLGNVYVAGSSWGGNAFDWVILKYEQLNQPPVADAGADQTLEGSGPAGSVVTLDGTGSSDADGDPLTYTWTGSFGTATGVSPTVSLPLGSHTIILTVADGKGGTDSDEVVAKIEDTTSPTIALSLNTTSLWPVNHKMHLVASGISASDICDPSPALSVTVTSNEPDNGKGDGDTEPDWKVVDNGDRTFDVWMRAERSGKSSGRVYTITATATDGSGNSATRVADVTVDHDKGKATAKSIATAEDLDLGVGNYPNPFNPSTTIRYALPEAVPVRLTIYNIMGQPVRVLVDVFQGSGHYAVEWDGRDALGKKVAPGVYLYRLEAGQQAEVRKMVFAK